MADQIVITEKTSQAKDVRTAIGFRYGMVLPAEGHLFDLLEPEDVVPEWKRWSTSVCRRVMPHAQCHWPFHFSQICLQPPTSVGKKFNLAPQAL